MNTDIRLGKILGIPIGLHFSWFLIAALSTWSLATGYFPQAYPEMSQPVYWLLGLFTSLLFFGSVLAHELGHAILALRNKIPVRNITLFIFGGVAQIEAEPRSPGAEFRIAIAGPLVSLALALFFETLYLFDQALPLLAAPSDYLARINFTLAAFNLIPGFPLDGGRVLRSIVWKLTGKFDRATQVASFTGQLVAFGFIGVGILTLLSGNFFNGLWLAFIGWFLQNAAANSYAQVTVQNALKGLTVGQAMHRELPVAPALTPLSRLVEERVLGKGQRTFFVTDDCRLQGMLTLNEIAAVPKSKWGLTTLEQAMIPANRLVSLNPGVELVDALRKMDTHNVAHLPVTDGDCLVGVLSRDGVVHYLRLRTELRM